MKLSHRCEKCNSQLEVTMSSLDPQTDELRIYIANCKLCEKLAGTQGELRGMDKAKEILLKPVEA